MNSLNCISLTSDFFLGVKICFLTWSALNSPLALIFNNSISSLDKFSNYLSICFLGIKLAMFWKGKGCLGAFKSWAALLLFFVSTSPNCTNFYSCVCFKSSAYSSYVFSCSSFFFFFINWLKNFYRFSISIYFYTLFFLMSRISISSVESLLTLLT